MFGGQKHFRMFFAVKVEVVVVSEKSLSSSFQPFLRPMDKIRNIIPHIQSGFRGSYSHNHAANLSILPVPLMVETLFPVVVNILVFDQACWKLVPLAWPVGSGTIF